MTGLVQDLRYALRGLRRSPGFTAVAIVTLALGIGANTAIFSAVYHVLMRPLPVEGLDRIIVVQSDAPGLNLRRFGLTPESAFELNRRRDLFEAVGGYQTRQAIMTGFGEPQLVRTASTAGDFFRVLRSTPRVGRLYGTDDSEPGRQYIAVVSHGFWLRVGGAAPDFVGRKISLNEGAYEVIGVLPPGAEYPKSADIWTPMPSDDRAWRPAQVLVAIARLQRDVTPARAEAELRRFAEGWNAPKGYGLTIVTQPFIEYLAGSLRPVLMILIGAVGLVLLTACINVASLQLVRATVRSREIALRTALGAGRWVLVRRALTESLLVALLGGAAGVLLGQLVIGGLRTWRPEAFPQLAELRLDWAVLVFAAVTSVFVGVAVGLIPALRVGRVDLNTTLRASGRTATGSVTHHRLLNGFGAAQFALAFMLLAGSMLLVRSFGELLKSDPGFKPDRLVSMSVTLPASRYSQPEPRLAFYRELQTRLAAVPGVQTALTTNLPLGEYVNSSPFQILHRPAAADAPQPHAERVVVTAGYFQVMGIPLIRGRNFESSDALPSPYVALIDAELSREFFAHDDPLGKQIRHGGRVATIIGVVGSVSQKEIGGPPKATVYYFAEREPSNRMTLVVASSFDIGEVAGLVRGVVSQIETGAPVTDVRRVREVVSNSLATRQLAMWVMTAFGALSLLMAVVGIYGIFSYTTSERTQEIGIRLSLGALPKHVRAMILGRAAFLIVLGTSIGLAGSIMLSRQLDALVYGVGPRDPLTLSVAMVVLIMTGVAASWLPARRAARVDPLVALRYE